MARAMWQAARAVGSGFRPALGAEDWHSGRRASAPGATRSRRHHGARVGHVQDAHARCCSCSSSPTLNTQHSAVVQEEEVEVVVVPSRPNPEARTTVKWCVVALVAAPSALRHQLPRFN